MTPTFPDRNRYLRVDTHSSIDDMRRPAYLSMTGGRIQTPASDTPQSDSRAGRCGGVLFSSASAHDSRSTYSYTAAARSPRMRTARSLTHRDQFFLFFFFSVYPSLFPSSAATRPLTRRSIRLCPPAVVAVLRLIDRWWMMVVIAWYGRVAGSFST